MEKSHCIFLLALLVHVWGCRNYWMPPSREREEPQGLSRGTGLWLALPGNCLLHVLSVPRVTVQVVEGSFRSVLEAQHSLAPVWACGLYSKIEERLGLCLTFLETDQTCFMLVGGGPLGVGRGPGEGCIGPEGQS